VSGRGTETLGAVYAHALAEAAEAKGALEPVGEELLAFAASWRAEPKVRTFFLSSAVKRDAKHAAIDRTFRGKASDLFADFLHVLLERQRLALLPEAADAYETVLDRRLGRVRVSLATATPLPPDAVEAVRARLEASLGKKPVLSHVVRPALLGGAVLRVGDVVADGSVRRRLVELRDRLSKPGAVAPVA
jgi:F-type H+-transporting ATPase subunit delta